jgi:signal transduction histidine kinase
MNNITVRSFVEFCIKKFENEAKLKNVVVLYDYYDINEDLVVMGDGTKLNLVLGNMISNAISFTGVNSAVGEMKEVLVKSYIVTRKNQNKEWGVRLEVTDKGPGITRVYITYMNFPYLNKF